jgi:hypothetical protein
VWLDCHVLQSKVYPNYEPNNNHNIGTSRQKVASSYVHGMEQRLKYGIPTLRLPKRVPAEAFQGLKVAVLVVPNAHWHSAVNGAGTYGCPTRPETETWQIERLWFEKQITKINEELFMGNEWEWRQNKFKACLYKIWYRFIKNRMLYRMNNNGNDGSGSCSDAVRLGKPIYPLSSTTNTAVFTVKEK